MISSLQAVSTVLGNHPPASSPNQIRKSAQEFEAQLLATLLAPLTQSFSTVPGEQSAAGSDQYGFLGGQALASALSRSGGIGIADLLVRKLEETKVGGGGSVQKPAG